MVFFSQGPQKTSEPNLVFFFSAVFRYYPSGIERAKSEPSKSDEAWRPTVHGQNICPTVCVNQEFVLTGTELVIVRNGGRTNQLPSMSNGADLPSESSRCTVTLGFYVLQSAFMRRDRRRAQSWLPSPAAEVARRRATDFWRTSGPASFTAVRSNVFLFSPKV